MKDKSPVVRKSSRQSKPSAKLKEIDSPPIKLKDEQQKEKKKLKRKRLSETVRKETGCKTAKLEDNDDLNGERIKLEQVNANDFKEQKITKMVTARNFTKVCHVCDATFRSGFQLTAHMAKVCVSRCVWYDKRFLKEYNC